MSDHLNVVTRLSAHDEASPVLRGFLANIKRVEHGIKRFNSQLSKIGESFTKDWADQNRQMAKSFGDYTAAYRKSWQSAYAERLRGAEQLHNQITRLETAALRRRQAELRQQERAQERIMRSRYAGSGRYALLPGGYGTMIAGGVAAGGIAAAFKKRMDSELAEVKAGIFGELSRDEIKKARKGWIDRDAIKFGLAPSKIIDALTESLKAGFTPDAARQITGEALKAQSALELEMSELIKLAGKTATAFGGDIKKVDPARVVKMMNSISVAAAATAADPDEVIEAFKKGNAALSMSKLPEGDLASILSVAISSGIQPGKAGNAVSNLVSTLVGAGSARGQRARDLDVATRMLGFGSRGNIASRMAEDPTNTLIEMFKRMNAMSAQNKTKVARLLGGQEWDDEITMISNAVENIIATLREVKSKTDLVDKASAEKINSLQGRWNSIAAGFTLLAEKVGAGFDDAFREIADWFTDAGSKFDGDKLTERARNFVAGIKKGLGFDTWKQALDSLFTGASLGDSGQFLKVGRGIAEGLRTVWGTVSTVFTGLAKFSGVDTRDSQAMAKFVTELLGFAIVLRFLAPAVSVLAAFGAGLRAVVTWLTSMRTLFGGSIIATFTGSLKTIAKGIVPAIAVTLGKALLDAMFQAIDYVLDKLFPNRQKLDSKRLMDRGLFEKLRDLFLNDEDFKEKYAAPNIHKQSLIQNSKEAGEAFRKTAFSSADIRNYVVPASYSGGFQNAAYGGIGSRYGGMANGSPAALFKSAPGAHLPNFSVPQSGSIIKPGTYTPSVGGGGSGLNKSAFERVFAGTPITTQYDQIVAAAKANGITPSLLAAVIAQESGRGKFLSGNNPGGLMGAGGKMQFGSLGAGIDRTAQAVAKNWKAAGGDLTRMGHAYAPIGAKNDQHGLNRHWVAGVSKLQGEMASSDPTGNVASGVVPHGLADQLGIRSKTNLMSGSGGKWGAPGQNLTTVTLNSGKKVTVNAAAAESFRGFLNELEASGYKIDSLGGYSHRFKRGGRSWSEHAFGNAIDINPARNPMTKKLITDLPNNISDMAAKYGLSWGGDWKGVKDAMHFEWTGRKPWLENPDLLKKVAPADVGAKVPPAPMPAGGGLGPGMMRGGPATININGNSHDPEALATLVQRRIDESMNWRAHDSESEYT